MFGDGRPVIVIEENELLEMEYLTPFRTYLVQSSEIMKKEYCPF